MERPAEIKYLWVHNFESFVADVVSDQLPYFASNYNHQADFETPEQAQEAGTKNESEGCKIQNTQT